MGILLNNNFFVSSEPENSSRIHSMKMAVVAVVALLLVHAAVCQHMDKARCMDYMDWHVANGCATKGLWGTGLRRGPNYPLWRKCVDKELEWCDNFCHELGIPGGERMIFNVDECIDEQY